jgi:hypothetical protein
MKSFASLHYRGNSSQIKIEFERPAVSKFIHELYKHSARKIWQVAYLFRTVGVTTEQQARNRQDIERIISDCMEQVVRAFLPWEAIAKNYFVETPNDVPVISQEASTKLVQFEEESDSDDDSEEDEIPKLTIGDEVGTIDIEDLDKKEETVPAPEETVEEMDLLKEIESKLSDETLVLKL